jgi:hypothetical protein
MIVALSDTDWTWVDNLVFVAVFMWCFWILFRSLFR